MTKRPELKSFGELTAADFQQYPVWVAAHFVDQDETWHDQTDEETFRPWTGELPVQAGDMLCLVRVAMTLKDGRMLHGFATPEHEGDTVDLGCSQPNLFLPSGRRIAFWDGCAKQPAEERSPLYHELGKDAGRIFPIRYAAPEGLALGRTSGSIPGFCWDRDGEVVVYQEPGES